MKLIKKLLVLLICICAMTIPASAYKVDVTGDMFYNNVTNDDGILCFSTQAFVGGYVRYEKIPLSTAPGFSISFEYKCNSSDRGADGVMLNFETGKSVFGDTITNSYGVEFNKYWSSIWDPHAIHDPHVAITKDEASNHYVYALNPPIWDSSWNKITVTYSGTNLSVYVNAAKVLSSSDIKLPEKVYVTVKATDGLNEARRYARNVIIDRNDLNSLEDADITLSETSYRYDGYAKKPDVTVRYKGTTLSYSAYDVTYKDNTDVGTASVIITGKGFYYGTVTKTFTIKDVEFLKKAVTIKYEDGGERSYKGYYSDEFFTEKAEKLQSKLSLLSALGAASTYTARGINYASNMMKLCGFKPEGGYLFSASGTKSDSKSGHSSKKDNDHCRFQIGIRGIPEGDPDFYVVAVFINGYTSGGYEWISNFNLGTGKDHAGFYAAEKELKAVLDDYLNEYRKTFGLNTRFKFWITGHSRGAAITNILAIDLAKGYPAEDIYAFGFATPAYSRNTTSYTNIRNYIIPGDFVPKVAPYDWGFRRNKGSGDISKTGDYKVPENSKMKKIYKNLVGAKYTGFTNKESNKLLKYFLKFGKSQKNYNKKQWYGKPKEFKGSARDYCQYGLALALTDGGMINGAKKMLKYGRVEGNVRKVTGILLGEGIKNGVSDKKILATFKKRGFPTTKFGDAHRISAYIAGVAAKYGY